MIAPFALAEELVLADIDERMLRRTIEPSRLGVALDLLLETRRIERLEPFAEFGELIRQQLCDGLFEVFDDHRSKIALDLGVVMAELVPAIHVFLC